MPRRPRRPPRTFVVMFPCGQCGETAEWPFPEGTLPGYGAARCTKCGHRVVTKIEIRDTPVEPVDPDDLFAGED